MRPYPFLFVLALLWHSVAAADTDALLAKVAEAYGAQPGNLKGMRESGITFSTMRKVESPVRRSYQHPDRLRIEIDYPGSPELRLIRGGASWIHGKPMGGVFHAAMILQVARIGLPWNLLENRTHLRDAGTVAADDGRNLSALELPLSEDLSLVAEIDPASGHILRSRGIIISDRGRMEFNTTYENFKRQDGRLYAATEHHYAMGHYTGYSHIESVEFADALPEALFEPPARLELRQQGEERRL